MTTLQAFDSLLTNIQLDNDETLSNRYKEITKKLNKKFRNTDSETANSLQVGSYGRYTGIRGISDLDMMYIMPDSLWSKYEKDQAALLRDTRDALIDRWPNSDITYDTPVVVLQFKDFKFEIQPVFEELEDGDTLPIYWFPSTIESKYKKTKPKHEQAEMKRFRKEYGDTHRRLCKIMRAWKNTSGLAVGGLLLDTLVYNFLNANPNYKSAGLAQFGEISRDFFEYLKDEPKQNYYLALGSRQYVYVKHPFKSKAKKAYGLAKKAVDEVDEEARHDLWREIFGNAFPKADMQKKENRLFATEAVGCIDNEEFIEDKYPIDICETLTIDCNITAKGFLPMNLRRLLELSGRVGIVKSLDFFIVHTSATYPFEVKWKIRNVGDVARARNCLRGQIVTSNKPYEIRHETSNFRGPHYVECYIIKDNKVVARDHIEVPIQ